jgi:hypothetical protein
MAATAVRRGIRRPALPISFDSNKWDQKIFMMAKQRFSVRAIAEEVPLPQHCIYYRMRKAGVSLIRERNGDSKEAKAAFKTLDKAFGTLEDLKQMMAQLVRDRRNSNGNRKS